MSESRTMFNEFPTSASILAKLKGGLAQSPNMNTPANSPANTPACTPANTPINSVVSSPVGSPVKLSGMAMFELQLKAEAERQDTPRPGL